MREGRGTRFCVWGKHGPAPKSYREIEKSMQTSAATIARWRTRFETDRRIGLEGRHQGSRPRTYEINGTAH
jgi:transposase